MDDQFRKLREEMVAEQLVTRGISDKLVLDAMRKVPRHKFMPENLEELRLMKITRFR